MIIVGLEERSEQRIRSYVEVFTYAKTNIQPMSTEARETLCRKTLQATQGQCMLCLGREYEGLCWTVSHFPSYLVFRLFGNVPW